MWNLVLINLIELMWCVVWYSISNLFQEKREKNEVAFKWRDGKQVRKEEKANHLVTRDDGKYFEIAFCSHIDCNDHFVVFASVHVCELENATFIALLPQSKSHKLCVLDSPSRMNGMCFVDRKHATDALHLMSQKVKSEWVNEWRTLTNY